MKLIILLALLTSCASKKPQWSESYSPEYDESDLQSLLKDAGND